MPPKEGLRGNKRVIINCLNIAELSMDNYELLRNEVSEERRRKADLFYFKIDAYRSVCAEMLLQYSFCETGNQFVESNLVYNRYGKPAIKEGEIFFNLSHSGDWVVLAYGVAEVGVDIEKIQPGRERILDSILTEEERDYIYSADKLEKSRRFTQIWTLKESYIKYLGTGFSTDMKTFSIDALENVVKNSNGKFMEHIYIKSFLYAQDYYLSICSDEAIFVIKEVRIEDLMEIVYKKNNASIR